MRNQEFFMHRAFQLAALSQGKVAPNPLVGCVIVHPEYGIIGEGRHMVFGGPHAEVNAINSVRDQSMLKECIAFVNMEPCSHFGKTPPCADLLIEKKIKEVVISTLDPNPLVAGKGIEKLKGAGISTSTGILEKEGLALNRFFITSHIKKRPFITLKWAQTADRFIARPDGSSKWISSGESRLWVHKWRAAHQAILVGRNTLKIDNPLLNVRGWHGQDPIRLVVDPNLSLPENHNIFTDSSAPTLIFNEKKEGKNGHMEYIKMNNPSDISGLIGTIYALGIQSIFVEGGRQLLQQFVNQQLWDEALVFTSNQSFHSGIASPIMQNARLRKTTYAGQDLLESWVPES